MTLQQMEYIVALDQHRHFVLAAEACGVTQPTLSAMLQKLEEELKVKLFNRDKKTITPTRIGLKVLQQAQVALNEAKRIKEVVADEIESLQGTLRIGIIPTVAPYLVPDFISNFKENYPEVTLFINEMKTSEVIHQLEMSEIDLGIAVTPLEHPDLLEVPLYYERFTAYFSDKAEPSQGDLTPQKLPEKGLWVLEEGHCARNQIFNFCHAREMGNHIYEAGSIDTLVKIVDKNGGYTIIPELHLPYLNAQQRKKIRAINHPPAVREVSILLKSDFVRERMINAVADTIKKIVPITMIDERLKKFAIKL